MAVDFMYICVLYILVIRDVSNVHDIYNMLVFRPGQCSGYLYFSSINNLILKLLHNISVSVVVNVYKFLLEFFARDACLNFFQNRNSIFFGIRVKI